MNDEPLPLSDDDTIQFSEEASEQIAKIVAGDPAAAGVVHELFANMRQAMQGVKDGKYANFADAMEAITGNRPEKVNDER